MQASLSGSREDKGLVKSGDKIYWTTFFYLYAYLVKLVWLGWMSKNK